ncbi:MAG: 23S rRNA (guanosine(2251)-2'-O)-methyltransferase RlmB [Treponema sp.]|jgi:23S rRNA (guanosine2251-2'-O)-methyltransferase|nr:23S rRNA (guanosine(2251)-2'-O)-methyltransferase RlmB [Treponema sp.]
MTYITGFHAIEEHIKSGAKGPLLTARPGPRARELVNLAVSRKIRVDQVGTADLDRLAPGHRGVALESAGRPETPVPVSMEDFFAKLGERPDALVVILDEITDPHNYGAILRSCDQFGADLVVSRRRRSAKNAPIVAQTSAGASAWVPNVEEGNLARALELLKENGFWIYGADMDGSPVWELDLSGRAAIVIGGEAGLSRLLKERCDAIAAIPCRGRVDSLNVSVAAGVLLYETRRQRAVQGRRNGR